MLILVHHWQVDNSDAKKSEVASTKISAANMNNYGYATRELFVQFIARIAQEMPNATLAMFSKLKYVDMLQILRSFVQAGRPNISVDLWFILKTFDGLKGNFPIGFLIWRYS